MHTIKPARFAATLAAPSCSRPLWRFWYPNKRGAIASFCSLTKEGSAWVYARTEFEPLDLRVGVSAEYIEAFYDRRTGLTFENFVHVRISPAPFFSLRMMVKRAAWNGEAPRWAPQ